MSNLPDPTVNELEEAMMEAIIGDNPIEYSQNGLQKREKLLAAIQAHTAREVAKALEAAADRFDDEIYRHWGIHSDHNEMRQNIFQLTPKQDKPHDHL